MNPENIKTHLVTIPISSIIIPEDRARSLDPVWAKALGQMFLEHGNKVEIEVRPGDNKGEYILIAGLHRLEGAKSIDWTEMTVKVLVVESDQAAAHYRIHEVMENIGRRDLNVLDRAHHLFELKKAYETAHPETKKGGDRKSKEAQENQNEIFSFSQDTAKKLGVSSRSIELAVKLWKDLSVATRQAVDGTWLADHQAGLQSLASTSAAMQAKILKIVMDPEQKIASISDAIEFIEQGRLATSQEKKVGAVISSFKKLDDDTFDRVMASQLERVRAWFNERGEV